VVSDKAERVAQYHRKTIHATAEIIASAGLHHTSELNRTHIFRRISEESIARYDQIFPLPEQGSLLGDNPPPSFRLSLDEADPSSFAPQYCLVRNKDGNRIVRESDSAGARQAEMP